MQNNCTDTHEKNLNDPDNHDRVVIHLDPNILECEVEWALGNPASNKASGGDKIPAELHKTLKNDALKMLHSGFQQIWKSQ